MSLSFIKLKDKNRDAQILADRIGDHLGQGHKVVWLVSGGSNIAIEVDVLTKLSNASQKNLRVLLTDERYGVFNHPDSNLYQLRQAGFNPPSGVIVGVLEPTNLSFADTINNYQLALREVLDWSDKVIGQFGIGSDGHTAGILPHSLATKPSSDLVCGYNANDYSRITITPTAIERVNVAYVYAFGETKREALEKLYKYDLPVEDQPAQVFKRLSESYIINDVIGDSV